MANEKIQDRINEQSPWQDITEGNKLFEAATSNVQKKPSSLKEMHLFPSRLLLPRLLQALVN